MNLKDFASFALTLTLFSSLHHYNCLRRAHLHIFPHLLRHCSLLTYSNHMHAHTHTHANTFEVSDERTPTSMVGLWKRVCRRDKSVMQQMSACNNPSCQLWSSLNTHSYSMFRSHVTFSYTFCMERHTVQENCRDRTDRWKMACRRFIGPEDDDGWQQIYVSEKSKTDVDIMMQPEDTSLNIKYTTY